MNGHREMGEDKMTTMEWKEIYPEQSDWKKQIDVMTYYGSHKIGSIVLCADGWNYVINDNVYPLKAETEDEAKEEMIERLDEYFVDEINYYKELREILEELGKKRMKSVSA